MEPSSPATEAERIERLERQLQELTERLSRIDPEPGIDRRTGRVAAALARRRAARWALQGEQWTGRVGLVLLFLGLVFLFRYSVEQGWITPAVRVLFGSALGTALLGAGLRVAPRRASYGAILLAGAISVFYATGWAASYLFELVDRPVAFAWMAGVTVLALILARRHRQPALASLGALGGFATPFLLRPDSATVTELVIYSALVVLWTTALYLAQHWRSVLWTYLIGGLAVLAVAAGLAEGAERWLVQLSLLITWSAGAAYPFLHERRRGGEANPHPHALIPFALELRVLGAGGTAGALAITGRMWELPDSTSGALFLAASVAYGLFAWLGTRSPSFVARSAAPVAGALLATAAFLIVPEGPLRWFIVAALGAIFLYGGGTERFRGLEWVGHGLYALLAVALVDSVLAPDGVPFDALAWSHIGGVALAVGASQFLRVARVRLGYRIAAHLLALAWMGDEFAAIAGTSEWVTVAWGVYGAALLVFAIEWGRRRSVALVGLQAFAGSALGLAVLKLLIVDMAQVSPLVRIPLFLGSGLALIALSGFFQRSSGTTTRDDYLLSPRRR